jgi:mRNA interferase RelE/StbE
LPSEIRYKSSVSRDLKQIEPADRERVLGQIREVLGQNPRGGEPLHGEFEGLFKLRVGEYRVVYALVGDDVLVLRIKRRSSAYA